MNRPCDLAMVCHILRGIQAAGTGEDGPFGVRRNPACQDQPHPTLCAPRIKASGSGPIAAFFKARMHRPHYHAAFQR